eukprot:CAMPEP_0176410366 /NCGR_PEP_ID=MMETSP0127-20121128/3017_1 /TAXON_ID=938130 /ORGANISM="Platyophrya macrostoma, Strain WH" /LENGTH=896 /DNA_ID=CAMNT_0017789855 /DNA_START=54 /DNA_END=2744 /DNA_ORIENTATION=+
METTSSGAPHHHRTPKLGEWYEINKSEAVRLISFDDLAWELDHPITAHHVAVSSFGGSIAITTRTPTTTAMQKDSDPSHTNSSCLQISMYNSMGYSLGSSASIFISSDDEDEHDVTGFYDYRGRTIATSQHIQNPLMCCSTGNGVAVVMANGRAASLECEESGEYRARVCDLPRVVGSLPPSCVACVTAQLSDTGYTHLLLTPTLSSIADDGTVVQVTFHSKPRAVDLAKRIAGGSVVRMSVSPDATNVAFITEDGSVYISDVAFKAISLLFNTETEAIPAQLFWCGNAAVAYLHLAQQFTTASPSAGDDDDDDIETTLTIFDPWNRDHCFSMELATDVFGVVECDGIRFLSEDTYQFLQVVPQEAHRMFQLGSTAPSAQLLSAFDEYALESATSVRLIRALTEDPEGLMVAIDDCVTSAGFEFDSKQQQRLLRVASFGKSFCGTYDTESFVGMSRRLRVLHAVRKPHVGMATSMQQFLTLEGDRFVQRLLDGSHFQLAHAICEQLGLRSERVLGGWAAAKLSSSADDRTVGTAIIDKFRHYSGLSYRKVAQLAHERKRTRLARMLLEAEPHASSQVEALLDIKEVDAALKKAIESSDPDLIFAVLAYMTGHRGASAVESLSSNSVSRSMLLEYCLACDSRRSLLAEYYRDHPEYNTHLAILQYLDEHDRFTRQLQKSIGSPPMWRTYQERKMTSIQGAELHAKDEHDGVLKERLLRLQSELIDEQTKHAEDLNDSKFLNASVTETLRLLWIHNRGDRAEALAKRWKVTEKALCWIKLRALAQLSDWPAIDKLAGKGTKVKPPISYDGFVHTLVSHGRLEQAKEYIPKVSNIEERMELYLVCDDWFGAAMDCRKTGELGILEQLRERAKGNARAMEQVDRGTAAKMETSPFASLFR